MRIRQIIDLSLALDNHTQVYPGDPQPSLSVATTIAGEGYNLLNVRLGSQSGTHTDAPYHFLEDGPRLDALPLALFTGPGVVLDVTHRQDKQAITPQDLRPYLGQLRPGSVALLRTDWSRHYQTERYYAHPHLSLEAAQLLLDAGIPTFGTDTINIGDTVLDGTPYDFPTNRAILTAGGVILENLTNLAAVTFDPWIVALPIRLSGADGAPVRAVAIEWDGAAG